MRCSCLQCVCMTMIIQRMLHHSNTSTGKTMKTNNNHKHLRWLKDKSSQHNLLAILTPVRNVYVQLNNSRRPLFPRHSMLTRRRVSWCCEISSLRTASVRRPYSRPTLNFGGKGVCAKTTSCTQCSNSRVANFCPSTVPDNRV